MASTHKYLVRIAFLVKRNKFLEQQVLELTKRTEELEALLQTAEQKSTPVGNKGPVTVRYKMATIMYVDIQGFDKVAQGNYTQKAIDELDQLFLTFQDIAAKHKILKLKSIGDSFMCAGGIPEKNITNPLDVVLAALEMGHVLKQFKQEYEEEGRPFWDIRIGIHTGQVNASVSGKKKKSYDVSGDVVNIATRLAARAPSGQVVISEMTYELVRTYFTCDYIGQMPVKITGDLGMYHLRKLKPPYALNKAMRVFPNDIFKVRYLLRQLFDLEQWVLNKLESELPEHLYYHDVKHTIDVANQAELIGYGEGVDDESILLLKTAGLFHDIGHTIGYEEHEHKGTLIAREVLPGYGYSEAQIDQICELIMATKLPPNPKNLLEQIMCDADLDYLGRSDFIPVSNTLYDELKAQDKIGSLNDWNKLQVKFLSAHQFFTKTSQKLREVNKQSQVERIKKLIVEDE